MICLLPFLILHLPGVPAGGKYLWICVHSCTNFIFIAERWVLSQFSRERIAIYGDIKNCILGIWCKWVQVSYPVENNNLSLKYCYWHRFSFCDVNCIFLSTDVYLFAFWSFITGKYLKVTYWGVPLCIKNSLLLYEYSLVEYLIIV